MNLFAFGRVYKTKLKKFLVSLMLVSFMSQSVMLPSLAVSNIDGAVDTGVTTPGGGNIYDIEKQFSSGSTHFRNYDFFNLSAGDIANLIYEVGFNKFVNMVGSQVNINGILNAIKADGGLGNVIFVSPNGMIVGASGVLNVGALSIITPQSGNGTAFKNLWDDIAAKAGTTEAAEISLSGLLSSPQTGYVEIGGKIFSRGGIDITAKDVSILPGSALIAGISGLTNAANFDIKYEDDATLFNNLVSLNPNGITRGSGFNAADGKIVITAEDSVNISGGRLDSTGLDIKTTNTASTGGVDIASGAEIFTKGQVSIENETVGIVRVLADLIATVVAIKSKRGIQTAGITANDGSITLTNDGTGAITTGALTTTNGAITVKQLNTGGSGNIQITSIDANTLGAAAAGSDVTIENAGSGNVSLTAASRNQKGKFILKSKGGIDTSTATITAEDALTIENTGTSNSNILTSSLTSTNNNISVTNSSGGNTTTGAISAANGQVDVNNTNTSTGTITTGNIASKNAVVISNSALTSGGITTGTISASATSISLTNYSGAVSTDALTAAINIYVDNSGTNSTTTTIGGTTKTSAATGNITIYSNSGISTQELEAGGNVLLSNGTTGAVTTNGGNITAGSHISIANTGAITTGALSSNNGVITATAATGDITIASIDANKSGLNPGNVTLTTTTSGKIKVNGAVTNKNGDIAIDAKDGIETGALTAETGYVNIQNGATGSILTGAISAATRIDVVNAANGAVTIGGLASVTGTGGITISSSGAITTQELRTYNGAINVATGATSTGDIQIASIDANTLGATAGAGNDVTISNNGTGTTTITSTLTNKKGNVLITSKGKVKAGGTVTANAGGLVINSKGGIETGALTVSSGIALDNDTSGSINITGIITDGGNTSIINSAGGTTGITLAEIVRATGTNGSVGISNNGSGGIIQTGNLNSGTGILTINNTAGTLSLANNSGSVSGGNGTVITNLGTDTTIGALSGDGNMTVNNNGSDLLTISRASTGLGGNIILNSIRGITTNTLGTTGNLTLSNTTNASNISTQGLTAGNLLTIVNTTGNINTNNQAISGINGVVIAGNAAGTLASGGTISTGAINSSAGKVTIKGGGAIGTSTITANSGIDISNTSGGITIGGGLSQTATGNIDITSVDGASTQALTATAGNVTLINNGTAGTIGTGNVIARGTIGITNNVTAATGAISTGTLQTTGTTGNNAVSIQNYGTGNVSTGAITTQSGAVSVVQNNTGAGNIAITSIDANQITTDAGPYNVLIDNKGTGTTTLTGATRNRKGNVTVNSGGNIATNALTSDTGSVTVNNGTGTTTLSGAIQAATGISVTAGTLTSTGAINLQNTTSNDISVTGAINAATGITIANTAATGTVTMGGNASTTSNNISITSANGISTRALSANSGTVTLTNTGATTGAITTNNQNITANGNVSITNNNTAASGGISTGDVTITNGTITLKNNGNATIAAGILQATAGKVVLDNVGALNIHGTITATTGIDITGTSLAATSNKLDWTTGTGTINLNVTNPINTTAGINIVAANLNSAGTIDMRNSTNGNIYISNAINAATGINIANTATAGTLIIGGNTKTNTGNLTLASAGGINTRALEATAGNVTLTNGAAGEITTNTQSVTANGNIEITNAGNITTGQLKNTNGKIDVTTTGAGNINIASINANIVGSTAADTDVTLKTTGTGNITSGNITNKRGKAIINSKGSISLTTADAAAGIKADSISGFSATGLLQSSAGNIEITNTTSGKVSTVNLTATAGSVSVTNGGTGAAGTPDLKVGIVNAGTNIALTNNGANGLQTDQLTNTNGTINVANTGGNVLIASIDANTGSTPASKDVTITNNSPGSGTTTITGTTRNRKGNIIINSKGLLQANNTVTADDGNISLTSADGINTRAITATTGSVTLTNNTAGAITTNGNTVTAGTNIAITNNANVATGTITTGQLTNKNGTIDVTAEAGNILISSIVANTAPTTGGAVTLQTVSSGDIEVTNALTNNLGNIVIDSKGKVKTGAITATANVDIQNAIGDLVLASVTTGNGYIKLTNRSASGKTEVLGVIKNTTGNITVENTQNGSTTITVGTIDTDEGAIDIDNKGTGLTSVGAIRNKKGSVKITSAGGGITTSTITANENAGTGTGGNVTVTNTGTGAGVINTGVITNTKGNVSIDNQSTSALARVITSTINATAGDVTITNNGGLGTSAGAITANDGNVTIDNRGGGVSVTSIDANSAASSNKNILITNSGQGGINILGRVYNKRGNITVENTDTNASGVTIAATTGSLEADNGTILVENSGSNGLNILGKIINILGNIILDNAKGGINISGTITAEKANGTGVTDGVSIANSGDGGISVSGTVENKDGKINIKNTNTNDSGITVTGLIQANASPTASSAAINITNSGKSGINISGSGKVINKKGNVTLANNSNTAVTSGINVAQNAEVTTEEGLLTLDNDGAGGINIDGMVQNKKGQIAITNTNANAGIKGSATGVVQANENLGTGSVEVTNTGGAEGIDFQGNIINKNGDVTISSTKGGIKLGSSTNPAGTGVTATDVISILNSGTGGITIRGKLNTSKTNASTNSINIINAGDEDINIEQNAIVRTDSGKITITNNGTAGINVAGLVDVATRGDIVIDNATSAATGKIDIKNTGNVKTTDGLIQITNYGSNGDAAVDPDTVLSGINIDGNVVSSLGTVTVTNYGSNAVITGSGLVEGDSSSNVVVSNKLGGKKGINFLGMIRNKNGSVVVENLDTSATSGIIIGSIEANSGGSFNDLRITNYGGRGIKILGGIKNNFGNTYLENTSSTAGTDAAITIAETGSVQNAGDGNIYINNLYSNGGIIIKNLVKTTNGNVEIRNKNAVLANAATDPSDKYKGNIVIGDANNLTKTEYIVAGGNVVIEQENGSILNDGVNQALITATGNLTMTVTEGNIGDAEACRRLGIDPGSSIAGTTRGDYVGSPNPTGIGLYTETINVKVDGVINAKATNSNAEGSIINLRSKDSHMRIGRIEADNIMLTAADWVNPDSPTNTVVVPGSNYLDGYSIINTLATGDTSIIGKNISLIASDSIGVSETNPLVFNASTTAIFEAENNIYVSSQNPNVEPKIYAKRGDVYYETNYNPAPGFEDTEHAFIDEITAGRNLTIVHLGKTLTIYNLGKTQSGWENDDLLYPHDHSRGIIPDTINITVLDVNGGSNAQSVLTIYNAQVKGADRNQGKFYPDGTPIPDADVILRADVIIANAENAPGSNVPTVNHPNGYDPANTHSDADAMWSAKINAYLLKTGASRTVTGFTLCGPGAKIIFDIRGIDDALVNSVLANYSDPAIVSAVRSSSDFRANFNELILPSHQGAFPNPYFDPTTGHYYAAEKVYLSINSEKDINTGKEYNRGVHFNYLYADDAYIDSKDLNFSIADAIINNYAEFRNGNKGGSGGYSGNYRWTVIVDNDFKRHLTRFTKLTMQLYSKLTGSFYLDMGNKIAIKTSSPTVFYNPYEVRNLSRNENSFTRLTFKDDKIQELTTTPEFEDIDKDTYKPTKRDAIRFSIEDDNSAYILVSDTDTKQKKKDARLIDISKGGLAIEHDGSIKQGDKLTVKLSYMDIEVIVDTLVVRATPTRAGLKFVNMDKATANKILYMNLLISKSSSQPRGSLSFK